MGILTNVLDGRRIDRVVLFTGCTVVLALVVRQGIMLLDNITLTQELAQKENHFRSLVQGSSDVIMIAAPTGVLRYVSPAAAGVYGRDAEELVGSELASLIHPEDLGRVVHEVRRFLAAPPDVEPTTRIECRFRAGEQRSGGDGWLNVESTVNRHHGGLIFNSRDVTERVRLQAQLQHNASHDALTDLPNRALFTERVSKAVTGRRSTDHDTAVLYIDLDGFKQVNDTIGHQAGDELLIQAARRLGESVRSGDIAARLGGDEFAALITGDGTHDHAARELRVLEIADRLRIKLSEPYRIEGRDVRVAASIGVAFAEPGVTPAGLLRNADLAMYRAKQAGKGRVELYAPHMQTEVTPRAELATKLRTALHEGEFALLHQPVVELATGRVTAVAAHARWRSAQGILFTPAELLRAGERGRLAEDGERTAELGRWQLQEAVEQAAARHRAGHAVPVAVRLSARRLLDDDRTGLPPRPSRHCSPGTACPRARSSWNCPKVIPVSRWTNWSAGWPRCGGWVSGSRWTASAAGTPPSAHCAGFPWTSCDWTGGWSTASWSPPGCTRSPPVCCGSPRTWGCSPSRTASIFPNRSSPCAPWAAPTARAWPSPGRWTSTGCGAP